MSNQKKIDLGEWYEKNRQELYAHLGNVPIVIFAKEGTIEYRTGDIDQDIYDFSASIDEELDKLGVDKVLVLRVGADIPSYHKPRVRHPRKATKTRRRKVVNPNAQTLIAIRHPKHFGGKFTILAIFPKPELANIITLLYKGDPQDISRYSNVLDFALTHAHAGITIEDRDEFLEEYLPTMNPQECDTASVELLRRGYTKEFDSRGVKMEIDFELLWAAHLLNKRGSSDVSPRTCICFDILGYWQGKPLYVDATARVNVHLKYHCTKRKLRSTISDELRALSPSAHLHRGTTVHIATLNAYCRPDREHQEELAQLLAIARKELVILLLLKSPGPYFNDFYDDCLVLDDTNRSWCKILRPLLAALVAGVPAWKFLRLARLQLPGDLTDRKQKSRKCYLCEKDDKNNASCHWCSFDEEGTFSARWICASHCVTMYNTQRRADLPLSCCTECAKNLPGWRQVQGYC